MANTIIGFQTKLMRDYYKYFSKYAKGKKPEQKVAWVTAFTPVEILEALNIAYYYPESYAAVVAASEKEQEPIAVSERENLSRDCCAYSCCFNGCLTMEEGPRGIPPIPDILIATDNQCNTLPNWWNVLAEKYNVPLIVLNYPGEVDDEASAFSYVTMQHKRLIRFLEDLSGNVLEEARLKELIEKSRRSVEAWNKVISYFGKRDILPTALFDDINFLITARCKEETSVMYEMMAAVMEEKSVMQREKIPAFWLGYPLWYHKNRYLTELMDDYCVVGSNYITWWSLDYSGDDVWEALFKAYNYTFLNLKQETRNSRLAQLIKNSGAKCAIVLHNKSCKCDFVSAISVGLPQVELDIDMIDREYLDVEKAKMRLAILKDSICID